MPYEGVRGDTLSFVETIEEEWGYKKLDSVVVLQAVGVNVEKLNTPVFDEGVARVHTGVLSDSLCSPRSSKFNVGLEIPVDIDEAGKEPAWFDKSVGIFLLASDWFSSSDGVSILTGFSKFMSVLRLVSRELTI